ncbi:hypothetical protein HYU06_01510 [Candidatus Woesearchaeota archaeon]|nr:hypothetical protein [Candidatus Woesearchaeota archaeon]
MLEITRQDILTEIDNYKESLKDIERELKQGIIPKSHYRDIYNELVGERKWLKNLT